MKIEIEDVKFDERGLVPAVVQDAATGEVLMLAYMSAESLRRTLASGETWFWSRSRAGLWHKGATSGHTQRVLGVAADCDADALTVAVEPRGPACHTGARSCFAREVAGLSEGLRVGRPTQNREGLATEITEDSEGKEDSGAEVSASHSAIRNSSASPVASVASSATEAAERQLADDSQATTEVDRRSGELGATLAALYGLIEGRRRELPEGSYTTYLFREGLDKILKKVGEESAETIIAAKNADASRLVAEASDLVYHLLVLLVERGVTLEDVRAELARRAGEGEGE